MFYVPFEHCLTFWAIRSCDRQVKINTYLLTISISISSPQAIPIPMGIPIPTHSCTASLFTVGVCWERGVISAESFYHPLRRVWNGQDGAETTVMHGEWTTSRRSDWTFQRRRQLVHVIRSASAHIAIRCGWAQWLHLSLGNNLSVLRSR